MSYKLILCDGDSWTAGDLLDPKLEKRGITHINDERNDKYRLPKVWPYKLGKLCGIEVKNNSVAGSSNDGIVRRILDTIPKLLKQYKPEELCVIIGWSSPERKDFFKTYLKYFWNIEEFSNRYIEHNLLLHHYLENLGIKHYFFNAFYESSGENFNGSLYEKYFINKRRGLPDVFSVGLVEELVFEEFKNIFQKNFIQISFKKFCDNVGPRWRDRYVMNHPNENMHTKWSEYIYKQLFTEDGYFYGN